EIKPHKIKYYLERTDENFEEHMNNVLMLYKEVSLAIERDQKDGCYYVSYDEKPGIQVLSNIHKDKCPTVACQPFLDSFIKIIPAQGYLEFQSDDWQPSSNFLL
ncbi:hypothetical protein ACTNAK_12315, partial [Anaerobiospirillum succiniciproducens]